jgi:F-type H+-transporting ATPase subunit a
MNETFILILAWMAGLMLGMRFSSAVFGGPFAAESYPNSRRCYLCAASCCGWELSLVSGFLLVGRGDWKRLVACLAWICDGTPGCDLADAPTDGGQFMHLSPDQMIFWQHGFFKLNATIVFTWGLMLVLAVGSKLITRKLSTGSESVPLAEPAGDRRHGDREADRRSRPAHPEKYLGFLGTLFLFVAWPASAPSFPATSRRPARSRPPRRSRCACLWPCRCSASRSRAGRLPQVLREPTVIMLPFNIISELSRTLALAVRLFGNMMSGAMIIAILLTITPFHLPDRHDAARPAHRHGAGLHLQHPGRGLHRAATRTPQSPKSNPRARSQPPETTMKHSKESYGQHDPHRVRLDRHRRLTTGVGCMGRRSAKGDRSRRR